MDDARVLALLATLYDSYETGDTSGWAQHLAPDVLCIGTDEAEWWQGREVIVSAWLISAIPSSRIAAPSSS
jgi:ketosteroid isomerase-like protein